jgi:hypothetical protein
VVAVAVSTIVDCDPVLLWRAWRPAFSMRPREDEHDNRDLYPLALGLRIPVTLVAVKEMKSWTVEHRLPAGRLTIDHSMSPADGGRVTIGKRLEVSGPMTVPYRLFILPAVRRAWPREVRELVQRVKRPEP